MTGFQRGWRDRQMNALARKADRDDPEAQAQRADIRAQRAAVLTEADARREAERQASAQTIRSPVLVVTEIIRALPQAERETVLDATRRSFMWTQLASQLDQMRAQLDHERQKALEAIR